MEKINMLIKLGIKYLQRYKRRFGFLFAALAFCFAIVTFITSTKDRMYDNVYYSAQSHYAGDIVAVGYNSNMSFTHHLGAEEIKAIYDAANLAQINSQHIVKRTFFGNTGVVYFNGIPVTQKYIIGCDWENEKFLFDRMYFTSGKNESLGDDGIFISSPVADQLGAALGDSVTLEVDNKLGQKNTRQFIIRGIVQDSSIFGYYKVYISRLSLNNLLLFEDDDCSTIGIFLKKPSTAQKARSQLHMILSGKIQRELLGPLVQNREEMNREIYGAWTWNGTKILLYTMPVYLSEISQLMDAMDYITYLLYGIMLFIIFISASVTYKLILHERAKEMGIMRAIGFFANDLRTVLWTEVLILGVISLFTGIMLSAVISLVCSFISFDWIPGFEIFLRNGKLTALYLSGTILQNMILTLLVLCAAVYFPSSRASDKNLPSLLAGEPL